MITIIVTQDDGEIDEYDFDRVKTHIGLGRRTTNEVCIPDRSVSAAHARITIDAGTAWIEDLNSTNGTYINGQLISRRRLDDGDEIILGKVCVGFSRSADSADGGLDTADYDEMESRLPNGQSRELDDVMNGVSSNGPAATGTSASRATVLQDGTSSGNSSSQGTAAAADAASDSDAASGLADKARQVIGRDSTERPRLQAVSSSAPASTSRPLAPEHAPHPLEGLDGELAKQPMHALDNERATSRGAVIEIKNGAKSGQILPIDKPVTTLGRPGIQIAAIMRKPDGYFLMHIESDDSIDRPTLNRDSIGDEPVLLHSGDELNVAGIDVEFMLS